MCLCSTAFNFLTKTSFIAKIVISLYPIFESKLNSIIKQNSNGSSGSHDGERIFIVQKNKTMENNDLSIYDDDYLKSKIYIIRGVQVMIDADLAEIYGYETRYFNRQVNNNIERFDSDARFQLTKE